jgi:hypothetical protein
MEGVKIWMSVGMVLKSKSVNQLGAVDLKCGNVNSFVLFEVPPAITDIGWPSP